MARRIIATIVGFFVAVAVSLFFWYVPIDITGAGFKLTHYLLPVIIGSLTSGYVARENGWLYGLLVGVLCPTLGEFLFMYTIGAPWDWVIGSVTVLWHMWHDVWLRVLSVLIAGMLCGYLGQLLAQKWHMLAWKST